ncbi:MULTISPECIES: hypothetical protein [Photorhabdus]|uniref:Acid-shock protein n=3 Tax=Photorhabdus khanii TaxID=1004150 RepID=A0A4R4J4P0_9GAMM|nr:hypothetical protein [Photorhabdus khanii]ETS32312.1 hypothetical protein PTE_01620 [Photorhabdus khanii NC19]MQL50011.1 hypothetical protein [Photorhabdus khanii]OHV51306.1 hypothetical protein BB987_17270 [Photorhabdus temperata]TDB48507.1 hypothetical protein C5467_18935 [Photorhabdus khanii subsp. guanajuatensis]
MTRLGLSITALSLLFSGAVLAAPTTSATQSSDTKVTSSHVEKTKAGQPEKKPGKATSKQHSHHKATTGKTKEAKTH